MPSGSRRLPGEGEGRRPPRTHLRKLVRRIERLSDAEPQELDVWRLARGPRLAWVEAYDRLLEDQTALLDALLGRDDQEERNVDEQEER